MLIRRLHLKNWKNFQSVDFTLTQRAFFVGPNASGKSNLLDVFRFLRDLAASEGGGLQSAIAQRRGLSAVRYIAARRQPDIEIEADIYDGDDPVWRYRLTIQSASETKDKRPFVRRETVIRLGTSNETLLDRPNRQDKADRERLTETALEQTSENKEFREIAEFFRSIEYLHVVPQIVRDPARASDNDDDPLGGHLLSRINKTPKKTREARLRRMNEVLKVAVPQMDNLELEIDERGVPHLRAKYTHWRPQGAWQREDQFSDGTLRLLGLIWTLQESGGPILIEEPEISLNATVVSYLPPMISRATRKKSATREARQTIVTTHSPDLLSGDGIGLDEVLLLRPSDAGTLIEPCARMSEVRDLIAAGISVADAVLPRTRPERAEKIGQLSLL